MGIAILQQDGFSIQANPIILEAQVWLCFTASSIMLLPPDNHWDRLLRPIRNSRWQIQSYTRTVTSVGDPRNSSLVQHLHAVPILYKEFCALEIDGFNRF